MNGHLQHFVCTFHKRPKNTRSLIINGTRCIVDWALLRRLSDEQIRDAFRAANYSPEGFEGLTRAFKNRIEALNSLSNTANN